MKNTLTPFKRNGESSLKLFDFPSLDSWLDDVISVGNSPSMNVIERNNEFQIRIASPGYQKSDFNININGGQLEISSEVKTKHDEENLNYKRKEFSYSSFKRSLPLPENIDLGGINAKYEDGILKVNIPKIRNDNGPTRTIKIE